MHAHLSNYIYQIHSLNGKLSDLLRRMTKESENTKKALEKGSTDEYDDDNADEVLYLILQPSLSIYLHSYHIISAIMCRRTYC